MYARGAVETGISGREEKRQFRGIICSFLTPKFYLPRGSAFIGEICVKIVECHTAKEGLVRSSFPGLLMAPRTGL